MYAKDPDPDPDPLFVFWSDPDPLKNLTDPKHWTPNTDNKSKLQFSSGGKNAIFGNLRCLVI